MQTLTTTLPRPSWSTEQIFGLASDRALAKSSEKIATPGVWHFLGWDGMMVWGEFPNKKRTSDFAQANLNDLSCTCTCASRKYPCRHTHALLLLWFSQPQAFTKTSAPERVAAWQPKQQKSPISNLQSPIPNPRQANITAGMLEFERWLRDMVRDGLATLPQKPKVYWLQMANRLMDAQAGIIARHIRKMMHLPGKHPEWPSEILRQCGRFYLLTQGFRHFESMTAAQQADLRAAVGWLPKLSASQEVGSLSEWLVLGRSHESINRNQQVQRVWLWDVQNRRFGLLIRLMRGSKAAFACLPTGMGLETAVSFHPSTTPLRAELGPIHKRHNNPPAISGTATLTAAVRAYAQALALNPWLSRFPFLLNGVQPVTQDGSWFVQDSDGRSLPLPENFLYGWHLMSLSGGRPLQIFGEWDGNYFQPLSVCHQGRWHDLHALRGVK